MCHYNLFINFPTIKTDVGRFYFYWSLHFIFQLNLVLSYFCVWAPWFQGLAEGTVCSFAELPSVHLLQRKAQLIWWNCSRHGLPIWLVIVIMFSICSSHIRAGETTARWKTSESEEDMKNAAFHCTVWTFFFFSCAIVFSLDFAMKVIFAFIGWFFLLINFFLLSCLVNNIQHTPYNCQFMYLNIFRKLLVIISQKVASTIFFSCLLVLCACSVTQLYLSLCTRGL